MNCHRNPFADPCQRAEISEIVEHLCRSRTCYHNGTRRLCQFRQHKSSCFEAAKSQRNPRKNDPPNSCQMRSGTSTVPIGIETGRLCGVYTGDIKVHPLQPTELTTDYKHAAQMNHSSLGQDGILPAGNSRAASFWLQRLSQDTDTADASSVSCSRHQYPARWRQGLHGTDWRPRTKAANTFLVLKCRRGAGS